MSYTPPAFNAVNASWQGASAYSPPAYSAADAAWSVAAVAGHLAAGSPLGSPRLVGSATEEVAGNVTAPGPLDAPRLVGQVVRVAVVASPSPLGLPSGVGAHVVRGFAAAASPLGVPRLVGTVHRYELRGAVRDQGVLVNRTVRAYRRSTGALVAEGDTAAGLFALPVGFAADEYYLVPINLDAAATDFAPPCANRVTSVLAIDSA